MGGRLNSHLTVLEGWHRGWSLGLGLGLTLRGAAVPFAQEGPWRRFPAES